MYRFLALTIILVALAMPAAAQNVDFIRSLDVINRINSSRPEQNSRHERSAEVISDRVLDSRNKVVGEVRDVTLDRNGTIAILDIEFDRLRLGTDRVSVNYGRLGIRPVSNGYKMNYTDDQIVDLVPALLADIQPASGNNSEALSISKIIGRPVRAKNGRTLGEVDDVLFDALGGRAEYLLVAMSYKSLRGELVAIPFSQPEYANGKIAINNDFADAMIEYARER